MKTSFTIFGECPGKPRQTRSDKWKQRPCVLEYRLWADEARLEATGNSSKKITEDVIGILAFFHFKMPKSWSAKKKAEMAGRPHSQKPDIDNCVKSVMDSLFENDQSISLILGQKFWAQEDEDARTEVYLLIK